MTENILKYLLIAFLCTLTLGCGKKEWPEAQVEEDIFRLEEVRAVRDGSCLDFSAVVTGRFENLERIYVDLEELGPERCPDCPFRPQERRIFELNDPQVSFNGPYLSLRFCGLDPASGYRVMLLGQSAFPSLGLERSDLMTLESN